MTVFRQMPDGFVLREGLDDARNYEHIVQQNEYRLPDSFPPGAIIIDVGGQCGTFSHAVLQRGASEVYVFEPEAGNFGQLALNLSMACDEGRAQLAKRAVWRSDGHGPSILHFRSSDDPTCTGGGNVLRLEDGQWVAAIALDTILLAASERGRRRIHLLKLDCEGSEWPILFTAERLELVDQIIGEYHEIGGPQMAHLRPEQAWPSSMPEQGQVNGKREYRAEDLEVYLVAQGFSDFQTVRHDWWFGLFWARRPVK